MAKKKRPGGPSLKKMLRDNKQSYGDNQPPNPFTDPDPEEHRGISISTFEPRYVGASSSHLPWEEPALFDDAPPPPTRLTAGPREGGPRPTSARERKARRAAATAAQRGRRGKSGRRAA